MMQTNTALIPYDATHGVVAIQKWEAQGWAVRCVVPATNGTYVVFERAAPKPDIHSAPVIRAEPSSIPQVASEGTSVNLPMGCKWLNVTSGNKHYQIDVKSLTHTLDGPDRLHFTLAARKV